MDNCKILAVDDDPIVRGLLEVSLTSDGYQVISAASGGEAIDLLTQEMFDLVITDLHMGEPNGFAVIGKTKELSPFSKVIIITGDQDVRSAIRAIRLDVDDYLLKPFSLGELQQCVKTHINNSGSNQKMLRKATGAFRSKQREQVLTSMNFYDINPVTI